jgi:hypothetical protein
MARCRFVWDGCCVGRPAAAPRQVVPGSRRTCSVRWLEPGGEVAQLPGLGDDSHAGQVLSPVGDPCDDLDHVVPVLWVSVRAGTARRTRYIAAGVWVLLGAWPVGKTRCYARLDPVTRAPRAGHRHFLS